MRSGAGRAKAGDGILVGAVGVEGEGGGCCLFFGYKVGLGGPRKGKIGVTKRVGDWVCSTVGGRATGVQAED